MFGVGLDESQTLSSCLESLTSRPVINLGAGGTNTMFHWINSIILKKNNVNPVAVVYVWPESSRSLELTSQHGYSLFGPWNVSQFGKSWILHESHGYVYREYVMDCCELIWDCPVLHYEVEAPNSNKSLRSKGLLQSDYARDMLHPGPTSVSNWADIILKDLQCSLKRIS